MNQFEDELRNALRREEPPAGFSSRVLSKARAQTAPRHHRWIGAAIAAGLVLSAGGVEYRQYQGRKAKQELMLAIEIAGSKFNLAQERVIHRNRRINP